jgi:hypothetical protein
MVPLDAAHRAGGSSWSAERKRGYANYLGMSEHLVVTHRSLNRSKGSKSPDKWMPPENRCYYIAAWQRIKERWELRLSSAERQSIEQVRASECQIWAIE